MISVWISAVPPQPSGSLMQASPRRSGRHRRM